MSEVIRGVMDTNVLVAAFRSRQGASHYVFRGLRQGEWVAMVSNHLLYEYEEVLKREATLLGLSASDVDAILNVVCARAEEWKLLPDWAPLLSDPDDEPLAQLAEESAANLIVTHNVAHLQPATLRGIRILRPREFLAILRTS